MTSSKEAKTSDASPLVYTVPLSAQGTGRNCLLLQPVARVVIRGRQSSSLLPEGPHMNQWPKPKATASPSQLRLPIGVHADVLSNSHIVRAQTGLKQHDSQLRSH